MTIPSLTADQLHAAMGRFDAEFRDSPQWRLWENNQNYRYAINFDNKRYPVKQIVFLATGFPVSAFQGSEEANSAVRNCGFVIDAINNGTVPSNDTSVAELQGLLQALVLEDHDLARIEDGLSELNFFDAIHAVRSEARHSDFLAFLLNPSANHGLGDLFLRRLAQRTVLGARDATPVSALELGVWDLRDSDVKRESDNTDILIVSPANKLVVVIENKVDSGEHSDQLARYFKTIQTQYPDYRSLFLYLTTDGAEPSHKEFVPISYTVVGEIIEEILQRRESTLFPDLVVLLRHYVKMLRRYFMEESELRELARRIYASHQKALDYIFDHRPDFQLEVKRLIETLITERGRGAVVLDHSTKTWIRFAPEKWSGGDLSRGEGWTPSNRILLFEFENTASRVQLRLIIGPGPKDVRERLLNFASLHSDLFKPTSKTLNERWNTIWSRKFASASDLEDAKIDAVKVKLWKDWDQFLDHDLPRITKALAEIVGPTADGQS